MLQGEEIEDGNEERKEKDRKRKGNIKKMRKVKKDGKK